MKNIMFEMINPTGEQVRMKVIGVGNGGGNSINRMIRSGLTTVEFIAIETDILTLNLNNAKTKLQIGETITHGLGTGSNVKAGMSAIKKDKEKIIELLRDTDIVFIIAGMGGGTGTGAAPVIAQLAQKMNILTVGIITLPFKHEGPKHIKSAYSGRKKMHEYCDTLITIPCDELSLKTPKWATVTEAFRLVDEYQCNIIEGISKLINGPGIINIDFPEVERFFKNSGHAIIGLGFGNGENRATTAAKHAIKNLLSDIPIFSASNLLINISGDSSLTLSEVDEATSIIFEEAGSQADIIFGAVDDPKLTDEIRVTLIATISQNVDNPRHRPLYENELESKYKQKPLPFFIDPISKQPVLHQELYSFDSQVKLEDIYEIGHKLFFQSDNEAARISRLKHLRDKLLVSKFSSNPIVAYINSLWFLSRRAISVKDFAKSMSFIIQSGNIEYFNDVWLKLFYLFITDSSQVSTLNDIRNFPVKIYEQLNNNASIFKTTVIMDQLNAMFLIVSIAPKDSQINHFITFIKESKKIFNQLTSIDEGTLNTGEEYCLENILKHWYTIIIEAQDVLKKSIKINLYNNSNIFMNRWNKLKLQVIGADVGSIYHLSFPNSQFYQVRNTPQTIAGKNSNTYFTLEIKPNAIDPININIHFQDLEFIINVVVSLENPFIVGPPVKTDEMFFGRVDIINKIVRGIISVNSINYLITGRRRVGKTSLLYAISRSLPKNITPIFISTEICGTQTIEICQAISNRIINAIDIDKANLKIQNNLERELNNPRESFLQLLNNIEKNWIKDSQKKIVLLIDEALNIINWDEDAQSLLRYIFSNIPWISGIIAGPIDIINKIHDKVQSPLYNIFITEKLGPLSINEVQYLLMDTMKQIGPIISDNSLKMIYEYTGGYPYYIQALGYELLENYFAKNLRSDQLLEVSIKELKHILETSYPITIKKLSPEEKLGLLAILNREIPSEIVIAKLLKADFITKDNKTVKIRTGIEKEWIFDYQEKIFEEASSELWEKYGKSINLDSLKIDLDKLLSSQL